MSDHDHDHDHDHDRARGPVLIGVAAANTGPDETARRKSVLLLTPTTVAPGSPFWVSQLCAETLATLSTMAQYTPPCTMPAGWCSLGCRRPVVRRYRQSASSSHTSDQEIATPMSGFKVQPP